MPGATFQALLMAGAAIYQVSRSLRFRTSATTYLSRTFGALPVTRTKCHIHTWVKRSTLGAIQQIFNGYDGSSSGSAALHFIAGDTLEVFFGGPAANNIVTTQVFRDVGAWYCIDVAIDTTQATAANRITVWVNGVQVTSFGTTNYPAQNATHQWTYNNANNKIGVNWDNTTPSDQYLADFYFIDGTPLTPSTFGQFDSNGNWTPIKPTGLTYGANGFYLDFSDNSAATAAAIGADRSGNANNWTPTNTSVTAGVTNDSLTDSPTSYGVDTGLGGEARGDYCTLNALIDGANKSQITFSNGNLDASWSATAGYAIVLGTIGVSSGKWYWEATCNAASNWVVGIANDQVSRTQYPGGDTNSWGYSNDGKKYTNNAGVAYGATYTAGDVIGVALDMDGGTVTFYKNGASQGTAFTGLAGVLFPAVSEGSSATSAAYSFNFGQRAFASAAPAGYKVLCTQNFPTPAIIKPSQYFDVKLHTGNGATQSVTGAGFAPDFVWIKSRSAATNHAVFDTARGAGYNVQPNTTNVESIPTPNDGLTSFNSDGFSVGANANAGCPPINVSAQTYVDWLWKKGAIPGLDIVLDTGSGANKTVSHGLGVTPAMLIRMVRTGSASNWNIWHKALAGTQKLFLNGTAAATTDATAWNSTTPTSSLFSLGTQPDLNANGSTYVTWLFAEIPGFSKFGTYVGNGVVDGPFLYCGFRPRFLLIKRTDTTGDWVMTDAVRDAYNIQGGLLFADLTNAESVAGGDGPDLLSNGVKLRTTGAGRNAAAGTYIFAAFAEAPFKYARAR
jgi:SPRY domain